MRRRGTLRRQLLLSYLPLVLIPIVVVGLVVRSTAEYGLTVLVTRESQEQARVLAVRFGAFYAQNNTWSGVEQLFDDPLLYWRPGGPNRGGNNPQPPNNRPPPGNQPPRNNPANPPNGTQPTQIPTGNDPRNGDNGRGRLITPPRPEDILIADSAGIIIAANTSDSVGRTLNQEVLSRAYPIIVNDKNVGLLVIGPALGTLSAQQQQLLETVTWALLLSGTVAAILTTVVGWWFSRQISRPIEGLMRGVNQLAGGAWQTSIPVTTNNELADLTDSFNRMAHALTEQERLRKQMVADISHDLRTPLSVMALEVEAIKAGMQTPEQASESLQEEIEWLQRLVEDLHTLALMDAGQFRLQCDPTEIGTLLRSVHRHWSTVADQQQRSFKLDLPTTPTFAQLDAPRIRQLLGNLIGNAFKHTPSQAIVTLSARTEADWVLIEVSDQGQGIPSADLPRLFDRFYRGDRSRSRNVKSSGSGLGLSIAYQLAMLHDGQLTVTSVPSEPSEPSGGTRFTLRLKRLAA